MNHCMKNLRKIPMAIVGAVDISISGAVRVVNYLSNRGEKVWERLENTHRQDSHCTPCEPCCQTDPCCHSCTEPE